MDYQWIESVNGEKPHSYRLCHSDEYEWRNRSSFLFIVLQELLFFVCITYKGRVLSVHTFLRVLGKSRSQKTDSHGQAHIMQSIGLYSALADRIEIMREFIDISLCWVVNSSTDKIQLVSRMHPVFRVGSHPSVPDELIIVVALISAGCPEPVVENVHISKLGTLIRMTDVGFL